MKVGQAFPSKWIKAEDLGTNKVTVTIDSAEMTSVAQNEDDKLVIYFRGKKKGFVVNITNANMITEITGSDDTDDWIGRQIMLYVTKVPYGNKRVDAIRVDYPPVVAENGARQPKPLSVEPPMPQAPDIDSDDIPW